MRTLSVLDWRTFEGELGGLGPRFWRLWSASVLANLADGVFRIALPLLAVELTRSPGAVAGVTLARTLPWLVFALPAGALADRLDRRRTMVRVQVLRVAVIGGLGVLAAADAAPLAVLYVAAFVLGIGETLFDTAAQSVLPAVVRPADLSRANGRLLAGEMVSNELAGPPIGGLLAGIALVAALESSAAAYAVAALLLVGLRGNFRATRATTAPAGRAGLLADIAEGVRYLWGHRLLRTLALMVGGANLAMTAFMAVLVLYAVKPGPMGLSEAGFGLLLSAGAVGGVLGSVTAGPAERRLGPARVLLLCSIVFSPMLFAPAFTASAWVVGGLAVLSGAGSLAWNVVTVSLRQAIVPDHLLGRVNAGYRLLAWGTMPLGAALGGLVAETAGLDAVFVGSGVVAALVATGSLVVTDEAIGAARAAGPQAPLP